MSDAEYYLRRIVAAWQSHCPATLAREIRAAIEWLRSRGA